VEASQRVCKFLAYKESYFFNITFSTSAIEGLQVRTDRLGGWCLNL
jgi:hypothetical protein